MNKAFQDLFAARVKGAIASSEALGDVEHPGLKGTLREVLVRELLRPFLPPTIGIGHGVVISSHDEQSTEQDVVIYDKNTMPDLLFEGNSGIFPVESTLFTIEVKSTLTIEMLKETDQKIRGFDEKGKKDKKVKELERLCHIPRILKPELLPPELRLLRMRMAPPKPEHVIPCLFAFQSSGFQEKRVIDRYKDEVLEKGAAPGIRSICVIGKGYWFWSDGKWSDDHYGKPTSVFSEVAKFIDGIVHSHERVLMTRERPWLFHYVGSGAAAADAPAPPPRNSPKSRQRSNRR